MAYDILNEEYPDDDGDAGDPEDIEDLKIAQSDLETEINDLETELFRLVVPGFGMPRLKPTGPVPLGTKSAPATWDVANGCWRNSDGSVLWWVHRNEKRKLVAAARMIELNTISASVDAETRRRCLAGHSGVSMPITVHTIQLKKLSSLIALRLFLTSDALSALGGQKDPNSQTCPPTIKFVRHSAYWEHVLELLSTIEGGSISRSKFAHHLRAHLAESITRIEECAIAAGAKIEVEREVSEKERREMENEDYRLQAKRQKDRLNEIPTQRRRVNNFYASIRGGDIYACVCNGNFIGDSYRLHPPARTFHTAIDPEWHFWTPAEFEAWCRRLAEDYIGLTDADR